MFLGKQAAQLTRADAHMQRSVVHGLRHGYSADIITAAWVRTSMKARLGNEEDK